MSTLQILKLVACLGTLITGVLALGWPATVYGFTGLTISSVRGTSEIRATLGGLLIGLAIAPILLGWSNPAGYRMVGIAYLAIAAARTFSIVVDRSFAPSNWISLVVEVAFGVVLVI
jgi:hypothetical protein